MAVLPEFLDGLETFRAQGIRVWSETGLLKVVQIGHYAVGTVL